MRAVASRRVWHVIMAAITLMLALAATFASCWSLAYWPRPYPNVGRIWWSHESGPAWMYFQTERWGATRLFGGAMSEWASASANPKSIQPLPSWSLMLEHMPAGDGDGPSTRASHHRLLEEAFGWPMPALACAYTQNATNQLIIVDGYEARKVNMFDVPRRVALPVRPVWPGFVVNTVLSGIVIWPVVVGLVWMGGRVFTFRKRRRIKRGCCPACGYDLKGEFARGCPECGRDRVESDTQTAAPSGNLSL